MVKWIAIVATFFMLLLSVYGHNILAIGGWLIALIAEGVIAYFEKAINDAEV